MIKELAMAFILMGTISLETELCASAGDAEVNPGNHMQSASNALLKAQKEMVFQKGDNRLLILTNAGFGTLMGQSTEAFLDIINEGTGCTMGQGNLLMIHTPFTEPLWFGLFRKDTGELIFNKWMKNAFKQINISPHKIMNPKAWMEAASKPVGRKTLFSMVSVAHSWSMGAPCSLLKSAEFHNHICPGIHAGCILGTYLQTAFPLGKGKKYIFIASPPYCPGDAIQVMFDATVGKKGTFAKGLNKKMMKQYAGALWHEDAPLPPLLGIVLKVTGKADSCEGVVMGMDWKTLYSDVGMDHKTLSPEGGKKNPLFHITRIKLSQKMLAMAMADKLKYIKEIKRFSGKASLAKKLAQAGREPYGVIWGL
jgi:formylmethanofuran dehydrogenase subunit E-like metal-binding protein